YLKTIGVPQPNMPAPIYIDVEHGAVVYYGRDISAELTPLENRMLNHLWRHLNEICPVADIVAAIHPDDQPVYLHNSSEYERVRTLARRLRRHLEHLVPDQPVPLTIFHKRGYRLGIP